MFIIDEHFDNTLLRIIALIAKHYAEKTIHSHLLGLLHVAFSRPNADGTVSPLRHRYKGKYDHSLTAVVSNTNVDDVRPQKEVLDDRCTELDDKIPPPIACQDSPSEILARHKRVARV